jgi:hypothetical protein
MTLIKNILLIASAASWGSCVTPIKLTIPETFRQQATMQHVEGAKGNKMRFANFATSRIKRGAHTSDEGEGRSFFLENLLFNRIGIRKDEILKREKARFRYTLTDGKTAVRIDANEIAVSDKVEYDAYKSTGIFSTISQLQRYDYVFSALIGADTAQEGKTWQLLMTNLYQRQPGKDRNPFAFIRPDYNGLATNGSDTIFVKAINTRKTEMPNGRLAQFPFGLLSGYELSTDDGVIAIVDMINSNIWFYNELDDTERLNVAGIATAILARRVRDEKW